MCILSSPRHFVCVVNVLFASIGLLCLLAGSICFLSQEPVYPARISNPGKDSLTFASSHCQMSVFTIPLAVIMVPVSLLVTIISCLGCLSTGRYDRCAMKAYCVILTVMLVLICWLIFVIGIYNIYSNNSEAKAFLQKVLKHFYNADNDIFTKTMNYIMVNYECCGIVDYKDFNGSQWMRLNHTSGMFPLECCKMRSTTFLEPLNVNCTSMDQSEQYSNKEFGCYEALRRSLVENIVWVWVAVGVVLVYYSFVICSTYVVLCGSFQAPIKGSVCVNSQPITSVTSMPSDTDGEQPRKLYKLVPDVNPNYIFL